MAEFYKYVLDSSVVEDFVLLPVRQREQLIRIFRVLANDPFQKGEVNFRDFSGREIQKKFFEKWIVSFWSDHAVKEVRIIGLQRRK